jgi:hypothetical protein
MNHNGVVRDNRLDRRILFSCIQQLADADTQAFKLVGNTYTRSTILDNNSIRSTASA